MVPQSLNIYAQSVSINSGQNFREQTRSGRAFPVKNKDNTNAGECSTPMYYLPLNPNTQSTCNNGPEGKRERVRTGSELGQIRQYHLLYSYIILNIAQVR